MLLSLFWRRRRERDEERKSLFRGNAVVEEDLERDRATQVQKTSSALPRSRGRLIEEEEEEEEEGLFKLMQ